MPFLAPLLALAAVPHLVAVRVDKPPVLDGKLDEPAWQRAPTTDTFTQRSPTSGDPASERTVVRILYDDDNVYVGIDCQQSVEVVARLTRRDRWIESDSVAVVLDTRSDGKSGFEFAINAAGVLSDTLHFNDTDTNEDWDENWEGKTSIHPGGWSAELRIPLRALRFPATAVQSWGLQVRRYISARQELDDWAHIPKEAAGEVSHYGRLDDLRGLKTKNPIELRPFIVGTLKHHDPQGYTLQHGWDPSGSAGLDLKWHVSQSLTLDATIWPDFGQVEADQVILNLTNYEIYYPEKRPFFLEGVEIFSTPLQLLYTRRIGRAPPSPVLNTALPAAEQLVESPLPSTIYGAAKLVGDLGGHWSFGELVSLTGRQSVEVQPANGPQTSRVVDPYTAYTVLRLKREIGSNAHVGLIFTGVERLESGDDYPVLPGPGTPMALCPTVIGSLATTASPSTSNGENTVTPGSRCFHDSYAAGVDGRWRSPTGEYTVTGQAIGTLIEHGPPRTMPDGTVIKSGDAGPAVDFRVAKEGGKGLIWSVDGEGYGRRVDFNDLGFMARQNIIKGHAQVETRTFDPRGATLETHTGAEVYEQDNLDGQNQSRSASVYNFTKFKNFWRMYTELHVRPRHWDDREVGDGAALQRAATAGIDVWLASDRRKRVSGGIWTETNLVENGFNFQGDAQISLKVLPQWDVDLLPNWVYTQGEPRYFSTQGSNYLFGRQRAQSLSMTVRSTYTFTPRLTLQAYAQAILESEHFGSFSTFAALGQGTEVHLSDLRPAAFGISQNPDFESGTINASLVGRWEYLLGSTLFLVYTHSQTTSVIPSFGDGAGFDFVHIAPRPAEDAWLAKLSYWWG
jgi:hypothetical protein